MGDIDPVVDADTKLHFNGIDAETGGYLFEPKSTNDLAAMALGGPAELTRADTAHQAELKFRRESHNGPHLGVKEGIDATKIDQAGWGVIFPAVLAKSEEALEQEAILEALSPLLAMRRRQATKLADRYREYRGELGYQPGESKQKYLARLGAGPGPADPDTVPYYLLIVGSPQAIPYTLQYQIDVQYAVGRLHFDTVEEYANYARSVVAAEMDGVARSREIAFVGVANPDDSATQLSRAHLVEPLADMAEGWTQIPGWTVSRHFDQRATKANVTDLLGGSKTPALLFTASHGMGFRRGHPLQERHQGALLLQDWEGPSESYGPIGEELYLSADDIASDADLRGVIAFNFACFGAGTPEHDDFSKQSSRRRRQIAQRPFIAGLPRKLLGHPKGGALATIGHVDRAWTYSFIGGGGGRTGRSVQLAVFESTLQALMKGIPVGMALEYFNERYAEMASDLSQQIEAMEYTPDLVDASDLARMWTSSNDARGYAVMGDPAVRLVFPGEGAGGSARQRNELSGLVSAETNTPSGAASVQSGHTTSSAAPPEPQVPAGSDGPPDVGALRYQARRLIHRLAQSLDDDMEIEVRTYVSRDPSGSAAADPTELAREGDLRAFTRLGIDGSIEAVIAEGDGATDSKLLELHLQLVRQAQTTRAETLKTVLAALAAGDLSSTEE